MACLKFFANKYHSFSNTFLVPEELPIPIVWLHDYHLMLGIIHILRNLTFMLFGPPHRPTSSIFKVENQFMIPENYFLFTHWIGWGIFNINFEWFFWTKRKQVHLFVNNFLLLDQAFSYALLGSFWILVHLDIWLTTYLVPTFRGQSWTFD